MRGWNVRQGSQHALDKCVDLVAPDDLVDDKDEASGAAAPFGDVGDVLKGGNDVTRAHTLAVLDLPTRIEATPPRDFANVSREETGTGDRPGEGIELVGRDDAAVGNVIQSSRVTP